MKLHLIAAAIPLLSLLAAAPADAQVRMEFGVRFGPPPPRYEVMYDAPFKHAVWVRGHWGWDRYEDRYVWVSGHWVARRPAYNWVDGDWHRGPRGWYYREGGWVHKGNGRWSRGEDRDDDDHDGGYRDDDHPGRGRGFGHGRGND